MNDVDKLVLTKRSTIWRKYVFTFQPLISALFCILLVGLFFLTAWMDVQRTQSTLLDVFENKGLTIIETVETIAEEKLRRLGQTTGQSNDFLFNEDDIGEGFRLQEVILDRLIELAREIDRLEETNNLSEDIFEKLRVDASMQAIVVYDNSGEIILENGLIPEPSVTVIKDLLLKGDEIGVVLNGVPSNLVSVRRKNHEGSIVLLFDSKGFLSWSTRVVTQMAINEGGWKKGIHYFMVLDPQGLLLASAGDVPDSLVNEYMRQTSRTTAVQESLSGHRIALGLPERLEVYAPLQVNGNQVGIAWIGLGIEEAVRLRKTHQWRIYVTTGVIMLGVVLSTFLYYRLQTRHIRNINAMKEKLFQAERLASLGKLAAGVAHEIRNPLNAVSIAVQRIHREFVPDDLQSQKEFSHIITVVRKEINHLNQIIEDFVGPSRLRRVEFTTQRLINLLDQVVHLAQEEARPKGVNIVCKYQDTDLMISMDSVRLHQALFNLIKNSLEAIKGPGTITVMAKRLENSQVIITISDTGIGIPTDVLKQIFDFEYTTKEKGLGLGLPIANEIIQAHGGKLRIESVLGKGTTFELILPIQAT